MKAKLEALNEKAQGLAVKLYEQAAAAQQAQAGAEGAQATGNAGDDVVDGEFTENKQSSGLFYPELENQADIRRNPEVATQPLFFGKIEDVAYEKVLCIIYPNFSLYEITTLTSTLALSFDITIDYVASENSIVVSEDGLPCQPTKTLDQICIEEYSCVILPGMVNIGPALQDEKLISFLRDLGEQDILIAAISSAPLLLAKAGLLKDTKFTGGIWQNFFDYFEFLPRENFQPKVLVQDKQIITAIGFAHQEFARKVIFGLGLAENTDNYFKEQNEYAEEDLIFTLSDEEFNQVKQSIEKQPLKIYMKIIERNKGVRN